MTSEQSRISSVSLQTLREELLTTMNQQGLIKLRMGQGRMTASDILALIADDHNIIDHTVVRSLIADGIISSNELLNCGIDNGFVDMLRMKIPQDPQDGTSIRTIDSIPNGFTEVYFWGMKASGKSCALGAILSMARNGNGNIMRQHACQGGDYMNHLSQVFHHHGVYTFLPRGTDVRYTYEMRFSLTREQKEHPIALIDMSGEVVSCLYKVRNNQPLRSDQQAAFDTLKKLLVRKGGKNRKIHFFVIEYGAEDKRDDELGLLPDVYLGRAMEFLDDLGVFSELTDAIYIMLTKADRAPYGDEIERQDAHFKNYMSANYHNFYFNLKAICKNHDINGGRLLFVPFSIGEVCMRHLCHFDASSAREIFDYIIERSFYYEKDTFGMVKKILSN